MKNFYSLLTAILISSLSLQAQLIEEWDVNTQMFPNGADPEMKTDHDGNLILVRGESYSGSVNYDYSIQKYTPEGTLLWEIINEDVFDDLNFNVYDWTIDSENNIILGGDEELTSDLFESSYLMKISSEGSILWEQPVTDVTSWSEEILSVVVDEDDNIYVSAHIFSSNINTLQDALIKLNPAGDILWSNFYDFEVIGQLEFHSGQIFSISDEDIRKFNLDGDEIWSTAIEYGIGEYSTTPFGKMHSISFHSDEIRVVHSIYSENQSLNQVGVISLNQSGDILWASAFDTYEPTPAGNEFIHAVDYTMDNDGTIYIVGRYEGGGGGKGGSFGDEYLGVFSLAISNEGTLAWRIAIPLEEGNNDVQPVMILEQNDQVMLVCQNNSFDGSMETVYGRSATDGSSLWLHQRQSAGDLEGLFPRFAIQSNEGEIYIAGYSWLSWEEVVRSGTSNLFYLNKYDLEEIQINISELEIESTVQLWPNPAREILNIESEDVIQSVRIIGLDGKLVYQKENMQVLKKAIDISHLAPQLYSVSILTEKGTETIRFAKN